MERFVTGDVVVVSFPYADFTRFKRRPALVVAQAEFSNLILCQITSRADTSKKAIPLTDADFANGGLKIDSFARVDKLFTVERSIIEAKAGRLKPNKTVRVRAAIRRQFA